VAAELVDLDGDARQSVIKVQVPPDGARCTSSIEGERVPDHRRLGAPLPGGSAA
jgi:hypothetical protein